MVLKKSREKANAIKTSPKKVDKKTRKKKSFFFVKMCWHRSRDRYKASPDKCQNVPAEFDTNT